MGGYSMSDRNPMRSTTSRAGRSTAVQIGSAFISLIEPELRYEREFNRWYADDHFYTGGMSLP
jgi:hypothetical protein